MMPRPLACRLAGAAAAQTTSQPSRPGSRVAFSLPPWPAASAQRRNRSRRDGTGVGSSSSSTRSASTSRSTPHRLAELSSASPLPPRLERPHRHHCGGRRVGSRNGALRRHQRGVGDGGADGGAQVVGDVGEAVAGKRRLEARLQNEPVVAQRREDVAQPSLLVRGQVDRAAECAGIKTVREGDGCGPRSRCVGGGVYAGVSVSFRLRIAPGGALR